MTLRTPLVLASQSPRRRRLLEQLGLAFRVQVSPAEEVVADGEAPAAAVRRLALDKARPVAVQHPSALTLAADTEVVLDGRMLGKPGHPDEARAMLRRLSDRTHTVLTGLALVHPATERRVVACEATSVAFAALTEAEIEAYVATGSPLDKAGAYGIQDDYGAVFVRRIEGDYYNVVGLPLHRVYRLLHDHFADLLAG